MILPGTVLVADIDKGIDEHNGKDDPLQPSAVESLTATKRRRLDCYQRLPAGHEAVITQGDQEFSNGVVHQVNAVLMPTNTPSTNSPAVGQRGRQVSLREISVASPLPRAERLAINDPLRVRRWGIRNNESDD